MGINAEGNRKECISRQAVKKDCQENPLKDKEELEKVAEWLMSGIQELKAEKKKKNHLSKLFERVAVPVFACLSLCFMFIWLYGLIGQNQSRWDIQQMKTAASEKIETYQKEDIIHKIDAAGQKQMTSDVSVPIEKQRKEEKLIEELKPDILPQYEEISRKYPNLYGWLEIPDMEINMPVMQSEEDKDFYLHHDFTGAESAEGSYL